MAADYLPALAGAVVSPEVIDPNAFAERATQIAARQRSPATRATYAGIYRAFCAGLGADLGPGALTAESVRAWRDRLERQGRSPATIAKHLSALRTLADALGQDPQIAKVRSQTVARGQPRALSGEEFTRLLRMPDRRTRRGKRDLALLYLLGTAGLRRSEACALTLLDVDERRRAGDRRLRDAIAHSTSWWVTVRCSKRGRTRQVPVDQDALEAIIAWVKARPTTDNDRLLLSLPRTGRPPSPLSTRDVARIVGGYAAAAELPEDRRSPHVLRHTFCTALANAGVDVGVIRELAGHADIRTTTIYTAVDHHRLEDGIAAVRQARTAGLARLAKSAA
ncbi:MAG: tyrosine-type recombinase/integrase [Solirubrobacteraceae bacterium]